ncbi:hypothetical protein F4680DRAFT_452556 [Xylaria scruposa]|nr:hypothetical protein F4680DRAFT_452556 [Xylaria scruposa]
MSSHHGFLSPRGLLINRRFCCKGSNFTELTTAVRTVEDLPASEAMLSYQTGLSDNGLRALRRIVWPIIEKFQEIGCQKFKDACDLTLGIASTARSDYDAIFNGLEKLFLDPNNTDLRQHVDITISHRLANINALKGISEEAIDLLRSSTNETIEIQKKLGNIASALSSSDVYDMLASRNLTQEDIRNDLAAVSIIQNMIEEQDMEDQSGPLLGDLEVLIGAVSAITGDLSGLRQSILDSTQPGPSLLLNIERVKVLELWENLETDAEIFKEQYSV